MHSFAFCAALGPVGVYLLVLGALNLGRRPRVASGARESAALFLALAGFVVVGPMQLFLPQSAAASYGVALWALLALGYFLAVTLGILVAPPRLVIYNCDTATIRPILERLAIELDPTALWAGDCLAMPRLRVQAQLQGFALLRNVSLLAVGGDQSDRGWRRLEQALREALAAVEAPRNPAGLTMVATGLVILSIVAQKTFQNPQALAQGFLDLLRL
jgi:hypothetical protein